MSSIYSEEIIPIIEQCQSGDDLLFISPSTFFGYYSLGVQNFEEMCEVLRDARYRGVKIRLIVRIYEPFSAQAGKALLRILDDGTEIRDYSDNTDFYFMIRVNKNDRLRSSYRKFTSKGSKEFALKYFNGNIKCLPFKRVEIKIDSFNSEDELKCILGEFEHFWARATQLRRKIRKYDVYYHKRKLLIIEVVFGYVFVFAMGAILGISFVLHSSGIKIYQLSAGERFLFPLVIGILGGVISTLLVGYFKRRIEERLSRE